jgi:hypothetical protein
MECETGASLKEAMFSYDPCFRLQSRARSASRSACANEQLGEVAGLRRKPHGEVQEAPSIAVTADIADILPQPAKIAPSGDPVRRDRTSQTSKQTTLPKAPARSLSGALQRPRIRPVTPVRVWWP